ncbi:MAG: hypothetical protein IPL12_07250 [Bacteroidetes bacterium]|nr:hypothetical protein [Bacteroidota bacterium]
MIPLQLYVGEVRARVRDYMQEVNLNSIYGEGGTTNYVNTSGGTYSTKRR